MLDELTRCYTDLRMNGKNDTLNPKPQTLNHYDACHKKDVVLPLSPSSLQPRLVMGLYRSILALRGHQNPKFDSTGTLSPKSPKPSSRLQFLLEAPASQQEAPEPQNPQG